jgi:hypothetical protein
MRTWAREQNIALENTLSLSDFIAFSRHKGYSLTAQPISRRYVIPDNAAYGKRPVRVCIFIAILALQFFLSENAWQCMYAAN